MTDSSSIKVRLELYATKLKNVAGAFKGTSDPFAVITLLSGDPKEKPRVLGKTEVIKNSLSPRWTTCFDLDYSFGVLTRINVAIYDEIRKSATNKPMGSAMFEVGEVLGAKGNTKAKKLRNGGTLFARITRPPQQSAGTLHLHMQGVKLKNVDGLFGKSDPFLEISAQVNAAGGATWQAVYRSQPIMNDLNPKWPAFSLDVNRLCGGDLDKPILVSVFDWEKSGKHSPMGKFETCVNGLVSSKTVGPSPHAKSADTTKAFILKKFDKEYGKIIVTTAVIEGASTAAATADQNFYGEPAREPTREPQHDHGFAAALDEPNASMNSLPEQMKVMSPFASTPNGGIQPMAPPVAYTKAFHPTFVDYISGGLELELTIAIDFTGSNGDPRRPGTLHYIHPDGQLNDYEKAITAVGAIVARYDADQKFPVYGFGAKYGGVIQHCFQVGNEAELSGIKSVLDAYRGVFRTGLTMSGPTVFSEVINLAAAQARSRQEAASRIGQQAYNILLILTDGAVSNVQDTMRAVEAAGDAPLSIVIVGIGSADFSSMQALDDFQSSASRGRDICQFVEFSKYKNDKAALTRETLDEIPKQVEDYFISRGIKPLPPISGSRASLAESEPDEEDIDLSMDINDEGEIVLTDFDGAMYDDTKYDTYASYASPSAPPAAYIPHQSQSRQQHQEPKVTSAPPTVYAAPVAPTPVFHVMVPQGMHPGQQLQVKNPYSGQDMIVTIPAGVGPGGKFGVRA